MWKDVIRKPFSRKIGSNLSLRKMKFARPATLIKELWKLNLDQRHQLLSPVEKFGKIIRTARRIATCVKIRVSAKP